MPLLRGLPRTIGNVADRLAETAAPIVERLGRRAWPIMLVLGGLAFFIELIFYLRSGPFYGFGVEFLTNFRHEDAQDLQALFWNRTFYPPLFMMVLAIQYPLSRMNYDHYVLVHSAIWFLGGVSAAWCARLVFRKGADAWALFFFLCFPGTVVYSKFLGPESLLVLLAPLAILCFIKSYGFRRPLWSLALGAVAGLAMMDKWTFGAYVLPLLLGLVFIDTRGSLWGGRTLWGRRLILLALSILAMLAVAGPWYALVFDMSAFRSTAGLDPHFLEYGYFRQVLVNIGLLVQMLGRRGQAIWLLALIALFIVSQERRRAAVVLLCGFAMPLLIFSIPPHLDPRYLTPILPLLAWVPAGLLVSIPDRRSRYILGALLALLFALNHWQSFASRVSSPPAFEVYYGGHYKMDLFWGRTRTDEIVDYINAHAARHMPDANPVVIGSHPFWANFHSHQIALAYILTRDLSKHPRLAYTWDYYEYRRMLRKGWVDYVLLDCGPELRCEERNRRYVRRFIELTGTRRYITDVGEDPPRSLADIDADWGLVLADFRFVRAFAFEPGNYTFLFVGKPGPAPGQTPKDEPEGPADDEQGEHGAEHGLVSQPQQSHGEGGQDDRQQP